MLTERQKDLLQELMPALAARGVTRTVFRKLLGIPNHVMSARATRAGVRFSDYPPATPGEMLDILIEAGFPADPVGQAVDAASSRRMRTMSDKARKAQRTLTGGANLYALITQQEPVDKICRLCRSSEEEIADFLRTNEQWPLLRIFNACPRRRIRRDTYADRHAAVSLQTSHAACRELSRPTISSGIFLSLN